VLSFCTPETTPNMPVSSDQKARYSVAASLDRVLVPANIKTKFDAAASTEANATSPAWRRVIGAADSAGSASTAAA
jgi:hypothetical protein